MFGCRRKHGTRKRGRDGRDDAAQPDPQRTEDMIDFVERTLGITAEQRAAWDRLIETVRDSADAMHTARHAVDEAEPGALQRFAGFETVAHTSAAAFRRIRPALEGLYGALDDAQRKTLDELIMRGPTHAYGATS
jgi:cell pole-organizing protein PopZ